MRVTSTVLIAPRRIGERVDGGQAPAERRRSVSLIPTKAPAELSHIPGGKVHSQGRGSVLTQRAKSARRNRDRCRNGRCCRAADRRSRRRRRLMRRRNAT